MSDPDNPRGWRDEAIQGIRRMIDGRDERLPGIMIDGRGATTTTAAPPDDGLTIDKLLRAIASMPPAPPPVVCSAHHHGAPALLTAGVGDALVRAGYLLPIFPLPCHLVSPDDLRRIHAEVPLVLVRIYGPFAGEYGPPGIFNGPAQDVLPVPPFNLAREIDDGSR